jgi:phosphatidate phosphatase APP1
MTSRRSISCWLYAAALVLPIALLTSHSAAKDKGADRPLDVIVYPAYATIGADIQVDGRVIESEERATPAATDGKGRNFKRSLALLSNREIEGAEVTVTLGSRSSTAVTDSEGYFRTYILADAVSRAGWHEIAATAGAAKGRGEAHVLAISNGRGVISDVDDTLLITGVNSKRRMLANTLLRNPAQRRPFPKSPALLRALAGTEGPTAACCVFYLSGTPRQLQGSLQGFLDGNGYPRGILITKRVTNDASSESLRDQRAYKLRRLEEILARSTNVRFTLLGDDAEADPEIYAELKAKYPERIEAIWIRRVNPDPKRAKLAGQGDIAELLRATVN